MNKMLLILMAAAAMLTACNSNQADNGNAQGNNEPSEQIETAQQNNDLAQEHPNQDEWSSLPEYEAIVQNIDFSKEYMFETVTDNENERILLLANQDSEKRYKTVFIKNTNRLKIIDVHDEGQIFNEVLKNG